MLAAAPQKDLEAVLVAMKLMLEGMEPRECIGEELVRNVLARLNNPSTPMQAETELQLTLARAASSPGRKNSSPRPVSP